MNLLEEADFPSIRRALSGSLDSDTLPDELIQDDLYLKTALEWVASKTGDTGEHAKRAAIYYTAHLLAPAAHGQIVAAYAIKTGGQAPPVSWRILADEMLNRAERELSLIGARESKDEDVELLLPPSCTLINHSSW